MFWGQRHAERNPRASAVLQLNPPAVIFHDPFDDGQANADAVSSVGEKSFKQVGTVRIGNAWSSVADVEPRRAVGLTNDPHEDFITGGACLNGVTNQIPKELA